MGFQRKLKKINNSNIEKVNTTDELKKLVLLILLVTTFFFIFYGITVLILNKDEEKKETTEITQIDYEQILVTQILTQPEKNYYVIAKVENDANNSTYESLIESYYENKEHKKVYRINLNDAMNKSFIGDKTDLQGDVKNFKFEKATLLEIEDKTIKNITEGSTDILEKLKNLE